MNEASVATYAVSLLDLNHSEQSQPDRYEERARRLTGHPQRLRQEVVHPRRPALAFTLLRDVRSKGDDRQMVGERATLLQLSYSFGGFEAIED